MNLLNKLTIKNLKLNKKRTIVTIIGIMLSTALICAVASIYVSFINSVINYEKREQGNFHVAFYNVPGNDIKNFQNNRLISDIYVTKDIGYAKLNTKNDYKPYAFIKGFNASSLKNLAINLTEGRLPEKDYEIVIPTHLETNGRVKYKVGDVITLNVGKRVTSDGYELDQSNPYYPDDIIEEVDGEDTTLQNKSHEKIVDTVTKTYRIVGKINRPSSRIESYSAPGYTFITYIDNINTQEKVDLYVRYKKEGLKNIYQTTANILGLKESEFYQGFYNPNSFPDSASSYQNSKYQVNINDYLVGLETNPIASSEIEGLGIVVIIVILIIIFTSVFCIKNSFDISITEKIKQYGMLRSIGATKKQIKKNVFYEATILGLIGIPLGILAGHIATIILIMISNYYLKSMVDLNLNFSFSIMALIISIILGIVTIYASAFRSAKKASKISPIDSIRNSAAIKIKANSVKAPKFIKKIFGVGGEISYKNLKRNKKKYRTTVISIIVSVATFIALSSFMSMAMSSVSDELKISDYTLMLYSYDFTGDGYKELLPATTLDNIDNYSVISTDSYRIKNAKYNKEYVKFYNLNTEADTDAYINLVTLGDYQYQKYLKELGLKLDDISDKAILMDYNQESRLKDKVIEEYEYKYMQEFNYKIGDKISGISGRTGETSTLEIGYITDIKPFGLKNNNNNLLIVSDKVFDKLTKRNTIQIYFKSSNTNKLQDDIEDALIDVDINYSLSNIEEDVKTMQNLFTLVGIFLYGFIIVISLIGITNIFNTITTNMSLRRGEFAMLKSIGMTRLEFNHMIRLESLFMGLKSLLFGIPIGTILSYLIYFFLRREEEIFFTPPYLAILIAILVVFLLISLIMKYSINKINKQNTIETIRNENI